MAYIHAATVITVTFATINETACACSMNMFDLRLVRRQYDTRLVSDYATYKLVRKTFIKPVHTYNILTAIDLDSSQRYVSASVNVAKDDMHRRVFCLPAPARLKTTNSMLIQY